jgi:nucleoside-diphosphate-sugar epimerase
MGPIPKGATVAVTGSAGFIGGWIVRLLLDKGYRVRACVRDVDDENKTGFLKAMPGYISGRLTLHSADLDKAGCFDEIFKGCQGVAHVSHVSTYEDQGYVQMVCDHVINSINLSKTVNRVIVTSSIAGVLGESDVQELVRRPVLYEDRYPDELNPKRSAARGQGYSMGKILAERAFSDAAERSGRWDAITCCPGDNVGPILSKHQKTAGPWQHNIETMLLGEYKQNMLGAYRAWFTVDVRDTAEAHIRLLESVNVKNGQRFIAWSTETRNVEDVCASIDRLLPELGFTGAKLIDPLPESVKAREAEFRSIWGGCELRNERIRAALGMEFRTLDVSIRDCVESLLLVGKVEPKLKRGFELQT